MTTGTFDAQSRQRGTATMATFRPISLRRFSQNPKVPSPFVPSPFASFGETTLSSWDGLARNEPPVSPSLHTPNLPTKILLLRLLDSNFPRNPLWAGEFNSSIRPSEIQNLSAEIGRSWPCPSASCGPAGRRAGGPGRRADRPREASRRAGEPASRRASEPAGRPLGGTTCLMLLPLV